MKRFLAMLLIAGVCLFSVAPAQADDYRTGGPNRGYNNGHNSGHHHGDNHGGGHHQHYGRSYGYYRPGVVTGYGYPYGYGAGYYSPGFVNYGYPGAVFISPQSFGYGPAAVQSMFGF